MANDAQSLARFDIERDVTQRPEFFLAVAAASGDERFERGGPFLMNPERLGDLGNPQGVVGVRTVGPIEKSHQNSSANRGDNLLKIQAPIANVAKENAAM